MRGERRNSCTLNNMGFPSIYYEVDTSFQFFKNTSSLSHLEIIRVRNSNEDKIPFMVFLILLYIYLKCTTNIAAKISLTLSMNEGFLGMYFGTWHHDRQLESLGPVGWDLFMFHDSFVFP